MCTFRKPKTILPYIGGDFFNVVYVACTYIYLCMYLVPILTRPDPTIFQGSETTAIGVAFLMSMFGIHQDKQVNKYNIDARVTIIYTFIDT